MARFTQFTYKFKKSDSKNWFNVINKYYLNAPVRIKLDDIIFVDGTVSTDFFHSLPDAKHTYTIVSETIFSDAVTIKTIPLYQKARSSIKISKLIKSIAFELDEAICSRLCHNKPYVFIIGDFPKCDFSDVMFATELIDNNNKNRITRSYISVSNETIVLVLDDTYAMMIDPTGICDMALPRFDINNGFDSVNHDIVSEWNQMFRMWNRTFVANHGENWNNPIIQ